jgi:pimeloyl-ACP methyl ester carboxylesterase
MTAMVTHGQFLFGCETARRRSFSVNGLALNALEWGEPGRPALCFLHGGSAHAHWFDGVAPAFADRYHVVSLDQRGHGASDWSPAAAYATPDFAGDLLGVADALGWERLTLAGHSMGGHNAMAFAAWHPERLSALVIIDSRPSLPGDRLDRMHQRGHRGPRRHEALATALASFRLCPARRWRLPRSSSTWRGRASSSATAASCTASTRRPMARAAPPTTGRSSSASPRPP